MDEIAPGLWHWTAVRERIGVEVSSYYLESERVIIDPMAPPEGLDWFAVHGAPEHAILTNRHHDRDGRSQGDELQFVPDSLMDDPQQTKHQLRDAYRRLLELDFDLLLLAHGDPITSDARDALRVFLDAPG